MTRYRDESNLGPAGYCYHHGSGLERLFRLLLHPELRI